ncbi:glycosyltransferase family 9 protein [Robbsia sp. KACC 23696]|uniref:glycosyltransferase family 9 protein n=1 Tax=Robbsia sp. KACC 23696 TaxID=3149231 RepID=UPI00325B18A3
MSRLTGRIRILRSVFPGVFCKARRRRPTDIARILIVHRLRLGDALLLAPLLKKLRLTYPDAHIALTCSPSLLSLFAGQPYGITVLPYEPRDGDTVADIIASGPYDLAFVLGDNRYAWLALAAGSRWIVAQDADMPAWKRRPIDELRPYPPTPGAWGDIVARLVEGPPPPRYAKHEWPVPLFAPFDLPGSPYVVLHPGASSDVKHWVTSRWRSLAYSLEAQGMRVVWSGLDSEVSLVREIDPEGHFSSYAGQLNLGQQWQLLAHARALVCPDTGMAHLGRMVEVPTLALFGPGSVLVHGAGEFWADVPYATQTLEPLPCRNQQKIFSSPVRWARRCDRALDECINRAPTGALCMSGIALDVVQLGLGTLLDSVACSSQSQPASCYSAHV